MSKDDNERSPSAPQQGGAQAIIQGILKKAAERTMPETAAPQTPFDEAFDRWRYDPAISHLALQLGSKSGDFEGIDALLESAFEAGWTAGYNRAME